MNREELIEWRIQRLQALVDEKFGGSKAETGRALGYKDGAFVGQMLRGERPVSEKTVEQIQSLKGCKTWFSEGNAATAASEPAASYTTFTPIQAIATLEETLRGLKNQESREAAGMFLQRMAQDPHGRWAALLSDLIEKEHAQDAGDVVKTDRAGKHPSKALPEAPTIKQNGPVMYGPALTKALEAGEAHDEFDKSGGVRKPGRG